jgi:hypothetical protein
MYGVCRNAKCQRIEKEVAMASYTCVITNDTGAPMLCTGYDKNVGWKHNETPPNEIPPGGKGTFCNAGQDSAAGWANYAVTVEDQPITIEFTWSIPGVGHNAVSQIITPPGYVYCHLTGGNDSGQNPTNYLTFDLSE